MQLSRLSSWLFHSKRAAWLWLIVRVYLGWQWLEAGWEKVTNNAWVGTDAGAPIVGFVKGALAKTAGAHPDVSGWYASFLQNVVINHPTIWANLIAWGEVLVGVGLILGIFTALAAFFGAFMNFNYLLAGTVSTNPLMLILAIGIMLAWRIAGDIGVQSLTPSRRKGMISS